jgi:hypothetical protein
MVWKVAPNVRRPVWTPLARVIAFGGVGLMFLI